MIQELISELIRKCVMMRFHGLLWCKVMDWKLVIGSRVICAGKK